MIDTERIVANSIPINREGSHVIYWMTSARRSRTTNRGARRKSVPTAKWRAAARGQTAGPKKVGATPPSPRTSGVQNVASTAA